MTNNNSIYLGLPWPTEFTCYQEDVAKIWKVNKLQLHKELAGKSGAFVYLVHVIIDCYSGYAILKLDKRETFQTSPTEAEQLSTARLISGDFAQRHLPVLIKDFKHDSVSISLFSIAGDGLEYIFPLANLGVEIDQALQLLSNSLVSWSAIKLEKSTQPVSARELLVTWLGHRINPNSGGRLHDLLEKCGVDVSDLGLSAAGTVYPNPIEFCLTDHGDKDIYPLVGQQHGDCHGNNILLLQQHEMAQSDYFLIDFSLYHQRWPIFYDHAYLELSLLLENAGLYGANRWDALLTYSGKRPGEADKKLLKPEDNIYAGFVRSLRQPVENWITEEYSSVRPSAEGQQLLGRIAAGLNFANKSKLELAFRYKALIYAAHELKELYRFKGLTLPETGKPLVDPADYSTPEITVDTGDWREIWRQCSEFRAENIYVLVVGKGLNGDAGNLAGLGKLPWSMVLDFDTNSQIDGLQSTVVIELKKRRGFHEVTPEQDIDINFDQATLWLMACGSATRPETLVSDFRDWRFGRLRDIDKHLDKLRKQTTPRQLRVLFLHKDEEDRGYFEAIANRIMEVFYNNHPRLIACHALNLQPINEIDSNIACDPAYWVMALARHLGGKENDHLVYLPCRTQNLESDEIERQLQTFTPERLLNIGEDLEIVHPGLESKPPANGMGGFLRGNTISWAELGRSYDVRLEKYARFKDEVVRKLEAYSNETIEFGHEPGAGGTTIARRLAWDLHREFPCAVLRKYSNATSGRIASLYQETNLPVLIIMEAGSLTIAERERLFKSVLEEKARAVFVYVKRIYNGGMKWSVRSPLSDFESDLFLKKYEQPDPAKMKNMQDLAHKPELLPYRMPFFFGLYAFEENFTHVESFVEAHLKDISESACTLLRYISLVTRFSQLPISQSIVAAMVDHDNAEAFSVEALFGANASRLIIQDGQTGEILVRVIHPLIAEQILRYTGSSDGAGAEQWEDQIEPLSCQFITKLSDVCDADSDVALNLLAEIFIRREELYENGIRSQFAQLIKSIPSEYGQANVLKKLTEFFPNEAHFWNHRGRHSNMILQEDYRTAEEFLLKAIELQPSDPLHHHSLGMIYRFEVGRHLKNLVKRSQHQFISLEKAREEIETLYTLADESFSQARTLSPEDAYGYVANIQLTFTVIDYMRKLSGSLDYASFFSTNSREMAWLRMKLEEAKGLLDRIIRIQGQSKTKRVELCSTTYHGLMGDYEAMMSGLNKLLAQSNEEKPYLRRLITDCVRNHYQENWSKIADKDLGYVIELAQENIQAGIPNRRDFSNWFQAYRHMPGFDVNEAIGMMDRWVANGDNSEAHFYLYVLHFLKWFNGQTTDLSRVRNHLQKCRDGSTWSHEWLSKPDGYFSCELVHESELGEFSLQPSGHRFFEDTEQLLRVSGVVTQIKGPRSGSITIYSPHQSTSGRGDKFEAFFIPGTEFVKGRDENALVNVYIGFSHSGLRAWEPKKT